jgi:hypothetical protein
VFETFAFLSTVAFVAIFVMLFYVDRVSRRNGD